VVEKTKNERRNMRLFGGVGSLGFGFFIEVRGYGVGWCLGRVFRNNIIYSGNLIVGVGRDIGVF
jgi:hypothetical protein